MEILLFFACLFSIGGAVALWRAWQLCEVEVLSRDEIDLRSKRLGLVGRSDRLIRLRNERSSAKGPGIVTVYASWRTYLT